MATRVRIAGWIGVGAVAAMVTLGAVQRDRERGRDGFGPMESEVRRGFEIAPVPLDLHGKNPALVGLGSYIVNAHASCNDCHGCPTWDPANNPYQGEPGAPNAATYLAGGVQFGPFVSANLTPDADGRPAGLTRDEFVAAIRTGHDPDAPDQLLQVMPWPILRNMTDRDLAAIYEYLSAIPHAEPGTCGGPGE